MQSTFCRPIAAPWNAGRLQLMYDSGHHDNVFQAKWLPSGNNDQIISCAADGQARPALGKHRPFPFGKLSVQVHHSPCATAMLQ